VTEGVVESEPVDVDDAHGHVAWRAAPRDHRRCEQRQAVPVEQARELVVQGLVAQPVTRTENAYEAPTMMTQKTQARNWVDRIRVDQRGREEQRRATTMSTHVARRPEVRRNIPSASSPRPIVSWPLAVRHQLTRRRATTPDATMHPSSHQVPLQPRHHAT
jgi:hypothetical protein